MKILTELQSHYLAAPHTMRTLVGHWPGNHGAVKARLDMTESCPDLLFLLFLNISIIMVRLWFVI